MHLPRFALTALVVTVPLFAACSDGSTTSSSTGAATTGSTSSAGGAGGSAATTGTGGAMSTGTGDATSSAGSSATSTGTGGGTEPISGTIETKAAGALPNTVKLGVFTPARGSAQWRPKPLGGGGVLTVRLDEDPTAVPSRSLELTLYDDMGTLDAGESFQADAPNGFALHRAHLEVYESDGGAWRTGGDGTILVDAFDTKSVALTFNNIGQFAQAAGAQDIFVVTGKVTVPVLPLPATKGGSASLSFSSLGPEPITSEPLNVTAPNQPLAAGTVNHADSAYPFTNDRRAVSFSDVVGSTPRNLQVAFPSGHLPRAGQSLPLDKFDRVQLTYFEGAKLIEGGSVPVWEADHGTLVVDASTDTLLTFHLQGAGFQSESPSAKGVFNLDGQVSVPVVMP